MPPAAPFPDEAGLSEGQVIAARLRRFDRGEVRGPYTMELYPTMACNIGCVFCDTTYRKGRQQGELSHEDYLRIVEDAAAMGVRRIFLLGGGEPLVRRDVTPGLMRRIKELGIEGLLATNGTLFDEALIDQVIATAWDEIHFSLDSPVPAVADYLRGHAGAFARVTRAMCRIHGLKHVRHRRGVRDEPRMLVHAVVTGKNFRTLPAMVRFAHAVGAFRVNFDYIIAYRPEQHALKLDEDERSELPAIVSEGLAAARDLGIETTLADFLRKETLDRGALTFPDDGPHDAAHAPCLNPWYYLVVHASGRTSPCCVIPGVGDDVRDGLGRVWNGGDGTFFSDLRAKMTGKVMPEQCRNCTYAIISRNDYIRENL